MISEKAGEQWFTLLFNLHNGVIEFQGVKAGLAWLNDGVVQGFDRFGVLRAFTWHGRKP